jgi:hypothetical protein
MSLDELVPLADEARKRAIHPRRARRLAKANQVEAVLVGGRYVVMRGALDAVPPPKTGRPRKRA